jgi:hypothetical protein
VSIEKAKAASDGHGTKEAKVEMLCVLASWREKFMAELRVADVSRKGCQPRKLSGQEARRRFPGLASWRWILHADCLPSAPSSKDPAKEEGGAKNGGLLRRWREEGGLSGGTPSLHHFFPPFTHRPLPSITIKLNEGPNEG